MALNYLLSPEFQVVNTAGKPATGGYLEVYISGSRERYYCASDFNGTLYPFQVPLDSLGSNVVLADDSQAYDVYIYNRYGGELMSRYNVHPGAGGGIGINDITSSDGSLIVTETANGVDLRVNSTPPSILRATAETLYMDGQFTFAESQRDGQNAIVDAQGKVIVNEGWWHYDATVKLRWTGPEQNETQSVSLYTHNASDSLTFDLSYPHNETVQVSGEYKALNDSTQFILGVTGVPSGMSVELVDFGVHSIIGEGAGGSYDAGNGIIINEADRIISVDPDVVQGKLTAGNNITIEDNVISATAEPQQQADWTEADTTSVTYIQHKPDLSVYATQTDLTNGLSTKQDVISDLATIRAGAAAGATAVQDADYVHTDENFTTADKTKLSGIEAGAEINVQADWSQTDSGSDDYIKNKPSNLVQDANYVHTDNNYTDADVAKLAGIAAGAEVNVQADWSQTDSSADDYIKNKPTIPPSVTVDQTYDSTSANPQSGTAVAEAIGTVNEVPASTASDENKVLTVDSQGDPVWAPAQAPLTAGDGIDITNDIVSVDLDGTSLTNGANGLSVTLPVPDTTGASQGDVLVVGQNGLEWTTLSSDYFLATYGTTTFTEIATAHRQGKPVFLYKAGSEVGVSYYLIPLDSLLYTESSSSTYAKFNGFLTPDSYHGIASWPCYKVSGANVWSTESGTAITSPSSSDVGKVYKAYDAYRAGWASIKEVPSSTVSDENKVLTVNSSGNAEWVTPTSITVDQTYDPTSTNPQSGTAVAGALGTLSIPTATSDLTNDSGFITASDIPVQDVTIDNVSVVNAQGVAAIPRQVNADWSSSAGASEILNKPDLSVYATNTALTNGLATKQDTISDLATIRSGAQAGATAVQPGDLATVATTGAYSDLSGTPTIPTATSDLQNDSGFITLSDVPAQVQSDWNESDTTDPAYIQNKPSIPVLPTMKELVAGTNVTLTEGTTTVTITASAPVIGTITV